MRGEERFFLDLLGDYVHGRQTYLPEQPVDWPRLTELAKSHGLGGVVYYQCRGLLKDAPEAFAELHKAFLSDVFHSTCQRTDFEEVSQAFTRAEIPFLPMKGTLLARCHPVPQLRSMGDIDLVIHPEDRQRTHELMTRLGFRCFVDNHAVWTYSRDLVVYEIHDHMMYDPLANQIDYRSYFDRVWEHCRVCEGTRYEPDPDFHFLYLVTHTAKHIVNAGSGIRPFLDMVFLAQKESLNWRKIEEELEKLQLLSFTRICFSLCQKWFQVEIPVKAAELTEEFYAEATEKVLLDGVFGLDNPDNKTGKSARETKRSDGPYLLTAVRLTAKKLFPPYRDMQLIPWYSFVNGRPWLMPVAWGYRFVYCAKNKLTHSKELLEEPFTRRGEIEQRQEHIKKWGL